MLQTSFFATKVTDLHHLHRWEHAQHQRRGPQDMFLG